MAWFIWADIIWRWCSLSIIWLNTHTQPHSDDVHHAEFACMLRTRLDCQKQTALRNISYNLEAADLSSSGHFFFHLRALFPLRRFQQNDSLLQSFLSNHNRLFLVSGGGRRGLWKLVRILRQRIKSNSGWSLSFRKKKKEKSVRTRPSVNFFFKAFPFCKTPSTALSGERIKGKSECIVKRMWGCAVRISALPYLILLQAGERFCTRYTCWMLGRRRGKKKGGGPHLSIFHAFGLHYIQVSSLAFANTQSVAADYLKVA